MPKDDIKIFPIFDQTEDVLHQFVRLEKSTDEFNYGFCAPLASYYNPQSESNVPQFAFGAFNCDDMVGFARGYLIGDQSDSARIASLCVAPEFQRRGIGRRLLAAAEKSASLDAKFIDLIPLKDSDGGSPRLFYRKSGYRKCSDDSGTMYKNLGNISKQSGVVPIFHASETIERQCDDICRKDLAEHLDKKHAPMFVYVKDGNVTGHISSIFKEYDNMEILRMQVYFDFQFGGMGRSLFQAMEQYAIHRGVHRIELMPSENSKGFYKKMGMWQQGNFTMDKVIGCR